MSDDPLVHCPDCGEASLQKELSAPKFRLKGSGWYETDFKTDNKRNLHGESKDDSKSTTKPDAKPDSKADTKSDSKPSASKAKSD
jgi:predicted nucleic acid-binding Zn ribbon protein